MATPESASKNLRVLQGIAIFYGIVSMIYAMYSTMTGRGLAGPLIAKQIDWFGGASIAVTFCLATAILWVLPIILAVVFGILVFALSATVWPALGNTLLRLFFASPDNATPAGTANVPLKTAPVTIAAAKTPPGEMRWSTIFKTAVVLLGITGAVAAVLYFKNVREHSFGVYKLDVNTDPGSLPDRIGFIRTTGNLARDQASVYRDSDLHLIVPLTGAGWTPDTPVRYFLHYTQLGHTETKFTSVPSEFKQPGASDFTGRFGGRLPTFVERDYAKKGVKLDLNYRVLDWEAQGGDQAPMSDSHIVVLVIGSIITVSLLAAMVAVKRKGNKRPAAALIPGGR